MKKPFKSKQSVKPWAALFPPVGSGTEGVILSQNLETGAEERSVEGIPPRLQIERGG
jgi:hypothetical protein